jgi:Flp pilus assembly protein TadG
MSRKSNKPGWRRLGRAGVTSLEFGLVALLFLTVLIACMDLGRYYLVEHSLRTVAAEAARMYLTCYNSNGERACAPPTQAEYAAIAPFINNANLLVTVGQTSTVRSGGGIEFTATAKYTFTSYSPIWTVLNSTISETTVLWE